MMVPILLGTHQVTICAARGSALPWPCACPAGCCAQAARAASIARFGFGKAPYFGTLRRRSALGWIGSISVRAPQSASHTDIDLEGFVPKRSGGLQFHGNASRVVAVTAREA